MGLPVTPTHERDLDVKIESNVESFHLSFPVSTQGVATAPSDIFASRSRHFDRSSGDSVASYDSPTRPGGILSHIGSWDAANEAVPAEQSDGLVIVTHYPGEDGAYRGTLSHNSIEGSFRSVPDGSEEYRLGGDWFNAPRHEGNPSQGDGPVQSTIMTSPLTPPTPDHGSDSSFGDQSRLGQRGMSSARRSERRRARRNRGQEQDQRTWSDADPRSTGQEIESTRHTPRHAPGFDRESLHHDEDFAVYDEYDGGDEHDDHGQYQPASSLYRRPDDLVTHVDALYDVIIAPPYRSM